MPDAAADGNTAATEACDVFVIGGGPAGAAIATFLAGAGMDVVLAEKECHPRFHVGESLLPHSLPLLERLGVLDRIREIGLFKPGAEFISEDGTLNPRFWFARALTPGPSHAYQVRRSAFDKLLFDRAREAGVRTLEKATAQIRSCDDAGAVVSVRLDDGATRVFRAGLLADASGRSAVTARLFGEYHTNRKHNSAAIFGHFEGAPRLTGDRAGNIRIYLTESGWIWQIPLLDGVSSMGLVVPGHTLAARDGSIESFFREHAAKNEAFAHVLAAAKPLAEMRVTGNFSYRAEGMFGPGYVRVGDAFGFIDPIFSSGVHLALISADEAANAIIEGWNQPALRQKYLAKYEKAHRRRIKHLSWFIYNINDRAFREMLLNPRGFLDMDRAVISLLAGDFSLGKKVVPRIMAFKAMHKIIKAQRRLEGRK